jgi:phospholipid/cholesterol/gamma-HCH transport system substrate-binding protein
MKTALRVKWAKFRVAITSIIALAIFSTLVILITGGTLFEPKADLIVYLPDATGLAPGAPVRVDGVDVGKIERVALSDSSEPTRVVRVVMKVERRLLSSITADSTAQPVAETVVGDMFIQITTGKSPQRVEPGAEIPFKGSPDLMTTLDLTQFRKSLDKVDALLTDIENGRGDLGQFVMTDTMYRSVLKRVSDLERGVRKAADTTSAIGHELYTDELYRQLSDLFRALDDIMVRLQSGQGSLGQLLQDTAQHDQVAAQIASLRKSVADLRTSPYLASTGAYDDLNKNLVDWIRQVDDFSTSPLMASSEMYDNLAGMARELQGPVREFRQNPKKFLRFKVF